MIAEARASVKSDAELLARLSQGDIGALGELYDRHHVSLRRFVTRATAGAHDVDDIVQATFLAASQSAARYDGRPVCRAWLIGIAVQLLKNRRYSFARWLSALSAFASQRATSADARPMLEARGDVERALRRLGEGKRVALLLAEVEGLTCPEIATLLEIPVGTVWTRLHAARRDLRRFLNEDEAER